MQCRSMWPSCFIAFGLTWLTMFGVLGADDAADLKALEKQFETHNSARQYKQAEAVAKQGLAAAERDSQTRPIITWLDKLAGVYKQQARYAEAEPLYQRSLALEEKAVGADHVNVATSLNNLANVYYAQRRYADAEPLYQRALAIREKALGADAPKTATIVNNLANVYRQQHRYADAEPLYQRSLAIEEKLNGAEHQSVAVCLNNLANVYYDQRRYAEAEPLYQRALAIREKALKADHPDLATSLSNLANVYRDQVRYAEAEPLFQRALAIREKVLRADHPDLASSITNLADLQIVLARYAEAEPLYKRALAIREKALGPDHPTVAIIVNSMARLYHGQGHYAKAEPLYQRALTIREKALGVENPNVATSLTGLGNLRRDQDRYAEAESLYKRALAIREKALEPDHIQVAISLNGLANLYELQGRYAEAEPLQKRALAINEKAHGADHPEVASTLNSLALLYRDQGRHAEAEPLYQRALAIREKTLGADHPLVASSLNNLAQLCHAQGRYAEAEPLYQRALAIREKALGKDHREVATSLNSLAFLYRGQRRYAEAEPLYQRALAIREKALGPDHSSVANSLDNLAHLYRYQGRYADAEPLHKRALAINEKILGPDHPTVATSVDNLALLYHAQGRYAEAEPLVDRAIGILQRGRANPERLLKCLKLRAQLAWRDGRQGEAVADLKRALDLAEQIRGQSSGAEHERAEYFAQFSGAFELMVAWQAERQDVDEALAAIERGRARSLLDEMNAGGADLDAGRPATERDAIRKREGALKQAVAGLEAQLNNVPTAGKGGEGDASPRARIEKDLITARSELYDHYRQQRSSSPVYRGLLSVGAGPPRLSQLQRRVAGSDGLVLVYLLGGEGGYLLSIAPKSARVVKLAVDDAAAEVLAVKAGPLTAKILQAILVNDKNTGIVQQLATAESAATATTKLAALWTTLVPAAERQQIVDGTVKRLVVAPDGPLALLPFETLVVEPGDTPRYLLDAGPPILCAPSLTVLYNLLERAAVATTADRQPVLTVGDPVYPAATTQVAAAETHDTGELAATSRYHAVGGALTRLPFSGTESTWVVDAFKKEGVSVARLDQARATEAAVRRAASGRRLLHLACHGMADQKFGNFFGALALTPGKEAATNPADDGFLTLAEIYELNLKGCELAILSACETNYGPQQQGEGVWALSRAFLVAGSRRVVASNWLVDDEAAASLVSVFCGRIAQGEKAGTVDYAQSLQTAKKWVRDQDKWKSPYYWGTFVLVGPP